MPSSPNLAPARLLPAQRRTSLAALALIAILLAAAAAAQQAPPPSSAPSQNPQASAAPADVAVPRGKKLFLKDGTFQLVREYHLEGDRVRYYGLDSHQWDEIPSALVDWDATKKEAAAEAQREAGLLAAAHKQEIERDAEPLDIDASVQVAPGVFLPPGQGVFAFDGKTVVQMNSADVHGSIDKKQVLKQVLIPIPIVPSRHDVTIKGARSALRVRTGQPEFYLRTFENYEPDVDLVRVKVEGGKRQVENLDELFHQQAAVRHTVPLERWQIAGDLYRYTIPQNLPPGEYALLEVVKSDQNSLYVWDFAVDPSAVGPPSEQPKIK